MKILGWRNVLGVLALVAGLLLGGAAQAALTDGLVGWYKLDGNVNDASANALNGLAYGGGNYVTGVAGQGYQFIGDYGNYIQISNNAAMSSIGNEITVSYWIKKKLNDSGGTGPNRWHWYAKAWHSGISDDNKVGFAIADSGFVANGAASHAVTATSKLSLPDNQWALVTQVFSNGVYKGYINGTLIVQETLSITTINSNPGLPILIGKQGDTCCSDHLMAAMDDVRIYNRAISDAEIQQLYGQSTLSSLIITGSTTLNSGSTAQFSASAAYSDNTNKSVSPTWNVSGSGATISSSGVLTAGNVTSDTSVTVTASYTENGVTKTATQNVTIKAAAVTLTGLSASCPTSINAGAGGSCTVSASYSNGTSNTVNATWTSSNSSAATVSNNAVTAASSVMSDTTVTLTAIYTEGGITKTATQSVLVKAAVAQLNGLTVSCPASLNAGTNATCSATASYTNNTSNTVSATWTSSDSSVATMSNNTVTAGGSVMSDTTVTLAASYTEGGITKTATQSVLVKAADRLNGLSVICPSSLNAGASAICIATAGYTNNTNNIVNATWTSSNSSVASMSGNTLTASGNVTTDTPVSINASYTENGVTKTATAMVAVKAAVLVPVNLLIDGMGTLKSGESASFTATVVYSDGSTKPAGNVTWTVSGNGASINANGELTAASVTADTTVTITALYTEGQTTKTANKTIVVKVITTPTACGGTGANQSGITIAGNAIKKPGDALDVSYCLKNFNSASKFDIYVAVMLPDRNMFFLQTVGFFGTPLFDLYVQNKPPVKYLANTLIPDKSGTVLEIPILPMETPTGTYTFYAIPVLAGKDVFDFRNHIGKLVSEQVTLSK